MQISLGICPVWSQSSQCAQLVAEGPRFLHADSKDSDQTRRMPRLIWAFTGRTDHFVGFVMRRLIFTFRETDRWMKPGGLAEEYTWCQQTKHWTCLQFACQATWKVDETWRTGRGIYLMPTNKALNLWSNLYCIHQMSALGTIISYQKWWLSLKLLCRYYTVTE